MNTQRLFVALSAIAIASTTAANAAQCYSVNDGTTGQIMTYPAVVQGSAAQLGTTTFGATYDSPLNCAPLFGKHTYFDDERTMRRGSSMLGYGYGGRDTMRVNEFSAVIPDATAYGGVTATKICGQKLSNSMFDIRLFGFGIGFGRVAPRWDARPAGLAI